MSQTSTHSRQSGDHKRRRSRGGKNRNRNESGRSGGDHRGSHERRAQRSEEFRPQGPRPPRGAVPVPLTWWQKLLKAIGLYKAPAPPVRPQRQPEAPKPAGSHEVRAPKSNTRNARSSDSAATAASPSAGTGAKRSRGERGERGEGRSRGGDGSTVESARVYVGNLSYDVTEQDLQELFKGIGGVRNVEIVYNRSTHRSKGYGFVEMLHKDEAVRAVEVLHDQHFMGRKMVVSGAKSKGQDDREDQDERAADKPSPVVVAPVPQAAVAAATAEPVIQTIVEQVAPVAETPVAEAPAAEAAEPQAVADAAVSEEDKEKTTVA